MEKLPIKIEDAFNARLAIFLVNKFDPLLNNHELEGEYAGYKSINIMGDYRAIFQDFGDDILFITIGTHSELY
jgi:mRNA-degrading endonuclease YafQ of YafQ-DinJ toxin-antitoxin module